MFVFTVKQFCLREIRKAPGTLESPEECSEVVLFTNETEILTKIADADAMCGKFFLVDIRSECGYE